MKIKTKKISYEELNVVAFRQHKLPQRPSRLIKNLAVLLSRSELKKVHFKYEDNIKDKLKSKEPCLILMNHSSFIDLKIAETIFKKRDFQIVCTSDGFVGKEWLMRKVGCIPTQKFVTDIRLVKDLMYCVNKLKTSILMFPEASYSFDGTMTPLPDSLGKLVKMLKVPVVMVRTHGAFLRDPLYNGLRVRSADVCATSDIIITAEQAESLSDKEILEIINESFEYDHFKEQSDKKIRINENFRTLGLERVLYKCPICKAEGHMKGTGVQFGCQSCESSFEMDEYGKMHLLQKGNGSSDEFRLNHIPDWYKWERECVKKEIEDGTYKLDVDVDIKVLKDFNAIYEVGDGRLTHDSNGFMLTGCDGRLNYKQSSKVSYSLYSDYFWYELGDMICIGDNKVLYYCFPKGENVIVAKARLAAEEIFKITRNDKMKA